MGLLFARATRYRTAAVPQNPGQRHPERNEGSPGAEGVFHVEHSQSRSRAGRKPQVEPDTTEPEPVLRGNFVLYICDLGINARATTDTPSATMMPCITCHTLASQAKPRVQPSTPKLIATPIT